MLYEMKAIEKKPKIGMLGIIYGPYEPIYPGITKRQEEYAQDVARNLNEVAEIIFPGAATGREDIERIVRQFNYDCLDGILIVLLTYSQGSYLIHALEQNHLPLMMACIQPEQTVRKDWVELDFWVNQGIHGSQDNANTLARMGISCEFIAENRMSGSFKTRIQNWAKAAQTAAYLKRLKIALMGRLPGMGDILTDDGLFQRKIGPEIVHEGAGSIYRYFCSLTNEEVNNQVEKERKLYEIDPKISEDSHVYAVKMYLAIKKLLEERGYGAYTAHFDIFQEDGRFRQVPLLAASNLMADGFGFAGEGDTMTAAMVAASNVLTGNSNFSEMYAMDFEQDSIVMSHSGEGNWKTARQDKKIRLIDRVMGEGGLENPPTPLFASAPGPATIISLISVSGGNFRMVAARGEVLDRADLENVDVPYLFFKPKNGVRSCVEGWLRNGGSHHEVVNWGDYIDRWRILCSILGVEFVEV